MTNTTSKGPWAIKNAVIPVDTDTEAFEIERAAARLGADTDGYDLDADDHIIGVSVTGPAETIGALVKLFTADDAPDATEAPATNDAPRTFSTGRKITLDLDNLGNAAIWQVFQIVTDGTNNVFRGDEEDASPAADTDAATEIFVHVAETAEERAQGADAAQAAWLLGTREEYHEIFDEYPEEQATEVYLDPEEYDQGTLEERDDDPDEATEEAADFDAMVQAWMDDPAHENIDAALEANATDTTNAPSNLYRAGVFAGLAEAAAWMIYEGVTTDDADDINAITAAIYKAYGVAW